MLCHALVVVDVAISRHILDAALYVYVNSSAIISSAKLQCTFLLKRGIAGGNQISQCLQQRRANKKRRRETRGNARKKNELARPERVEIVADVDLFGDMPLGDQF